MSRKPKTQKAKAVAYRFIPPESDTGAPMYALLRELVLAHHRELTTAKIALAWNLAWKPDVDGRTTLGMCKKVTDLEREVFAESYDFVIILRREFWLDECVNPTARRALLDHELCHATVKLNPDTLEPMMDERGRQVFRMRKHDLEEFSEIADRYGSWKRDIEEFSRALDRGRGKVKGLFVGYERLQGMLRDAGVTVPLEAIVRWDDGQRRDAAVWADVHLQQGTNPDGRLDIMPAFLMPFASAEREQTVAGAPLLPAPVERQLPPSAEREAS